MIKKNMIKINGMSCNHCVKSVEKAVSELPVSKYKVTIGMAEVEYDENLVTYKQIVDAIEEAGYEVTE